MFLFCPNAYVSCLKRCNAIWLYNGFQIYSTNSIPRNGIYSRSVSKRIDGESSGGKDINIYICDTIYSIRDDTIISIVLNDENCNIRPKNMQVTINIPPKNMQLNTNIPYKNMHLY